MPPIKSIIFLKNHTYYKVIRYINFILKLLIVPQKTTNVNSLFKSLNNSYHAWKKFRASMNDIINTYIINWNKSRDSINEEIYLYKNDGKQLPSIETIHTPNDQ